MKHSRNKQSIGFTLLPTWSRVVESHTVPHRLTLTHPGHESSLCSAWPAHESLHSQLGYQTDCCLIVLSVLQSPLFYLIMAPKLKSSDASNSDMLNRSCRVLRLSKDSPLNKERKKIYAENDSPLHEKVKKKKKLVLIVLKHFTLQKLQLQCMICA